MAVVVDHLLVEVEVMTVQVVIAVEVEVFPNRRIRAAAVAAAAAVEIAILHTMIMILDLFLAPVQGHHHQKMRKIRMGSKTKAILNPPRRWKETPLLQRHPRPVRNEIVVKVSTNKTLSGANTRAEEDEDNVVIERIPILLCLTDRLLVHPAPFHLHRVHIRVWPLILRMTMTNKIVIPVRATKEEGETKNDEESEDGTIVVDHPVAPKILFYRKINGLYSFLNWL